MIHATLRRALTAAALVALLVGARTAVVTAAGPSPGASAALVAAANKEGAVTWYATMNTKDLDATVRAFNERYPKIAVQTLRMGSSQLPARVITEQRGGTYNADVLSGDEFPMSQLIAAGALAKYRVSGASKFLPFTTDPNGYWVSLYQNTTVIAWNPQRLAADHLKPPTSEADFAEPRWKGKIGIDSGALNWYLALVQTDKNADGLMRMIAANDPLMTSGHTVTVTQLEAGEFDATPTAYGYLADQEKRAGKALDFVNPKPLFVTLNPVGLAERAPHPAAARVLLEWLTSREGQQFIASRGGGEISSRVDVRNNPRIWNPKAPYVVVPAPSRAKYNEYVRIFRSIFGIIG